MESDPVREAELVVMRAHTANSLNTHADTIDQMLTDIRRFTDQYDGDVPTAYAKMTTAIFEQVGDNPRFLAALAAALTCRAAGLELRS